MRYLFLSILLVVSCTPQKSDQSNLENDFLHAAKHFHELYIQAGDCEERNAMIDRDIIFFENGQPFTYENILEYCSYIQPKLAFNIYSKQYRIEPTIGFDYVEQYFINPEMDTLCETTSRIWQFKSERWVVTHMEVSRQPV